MYLKAQCLVAHAPSLPSALRKAIKDSVYSDKALHEAQKALFSEPNSEFRMLVGTTQAIDLVRGGVKTNALPEEAWAIVNHRIATDSSVGAIKERVTNLLRPLASHFNLSYTASGFPVERNHDENSSKSAGELTLSDAWDSALEPAPQSPIASEEAASPCAVFAGTIKAVYNTHRSLEGNHIVIAPGIMSGNTGVISFFVDQDIQKD